MAWCVGILYNPFQKDFLHNLSTAISNTEHFDNQEVYLLGDFNINLWHKGKYIFHNNKTLSHQEIHNITPEMLVISLNTKSFACYMDKLKQLISTPTRLTESKSSLLDHILTNTSENVPQSDVIDVALSDHQLIFATRKIIHAKFTGHRHITIISFKNYTAELYQEGLSKLCFPNYETFSDINAAYSDVYY